MNNWSSQKKRLQFIIAAALLILITGNLWALVINQRDYLYQLVDNHLTGFSQAYWRSLDEEAESLTSLAKSKRERFSSLNKSILSSEFEELSREHDIHHLALYGSGDKVKLLGLQDSHGLSNSRNAVKLLNLAETNEKGSWHLEVGENGKLLICVIEELQENNKKIGFLEMAKPTALFGQKVSKDHQILSLMAVPHDPSTISKDVRLADIKEPLFNIVNNDFSGKGANYNIGFEEESTVYAADKIKHLRFKYNNRTFQGSLRKAYDTEGDLALLHLSAIDITDVLNAHNTTLRIYFSLSALSFLLLIWGFVYYLRQIETDLGETYHELGKEVEARKKTEIKLIQSKDSLEQNIAERTLELSRLNYKLKSDIKARETMQLALETSEHQYRTLFDHSSDAMIILEERHLIHCNGAAVKLLQLEHESQIKEINLHDLLTQGNGNDNRLRMQFMRVLKSPRYDAPLKAEWRLQGLLGREFYAEITLSKIASDNGRHLGHLTIRDITEKKEAELKISTQAYFDSLTNLPNRNLFIDRLKQAISFADRSECYGAVLFLDLDNFKYINDSLGHAVGDAILKEVGQRLANTARTQDTIARFGGDEFVMLIPAAFANERMATLNTLKIANKIKATFAPPFKHNGNEFHLTPSIGATLFNGTNTQTEDILKHADTAMYQAKESGKNSICFFENSMQQAIDYRLYLESKMREAIKRSAFELHFQAKINNSGKVIGAEALCRWQLVGGEWVSPMEFIPIAEETGLISDLGAWVIESSIKTLSEIAELFDENFSMAINVSPIQIRQTNIVRQLLHTCTYHHVKPTQVTVEITESVLMQDTDSTREKLKRLKSHGFQISIDDFGTGYSSLAYLKHLSIDELKIDRSFVADIGKDPDDDAIVTTILSMARHLNLNAVAEGVETEDQLKFLQDNNCETYQGYYFSKPLSKPDFISFMMKTNEPRQLKS